MAGSLINAQHMARCTTTTALLVGFLAVCTPEVALALTLWTDALHAAALSYALLPFELAFWIGFALPLAPQLGAARTVLVLLTGPRIATLRNEECSGSSACPPHRGGGGVPSSRANNVMRRRPTRARSREGMRQ